MKAFLFPGQGSQTVGMGREFFENFLRVKEIFNTADEILGYKLSKIILDGPESKLKLTENTQPAILLVSYSIFEVMKKEFGVKSEDFKYFAGHSLGEYSALLAAESLSFNETIKAVHLRGKFMQEAVPNGKGSMLAVLNLTLEEVETYIKKAKNLKTEEVCEVANDNANGQIIVSGNKNIIEIISELLKKERKKSIMLPVSAPFHCSLMKPAAIKMEEIILKMNILQPKIPIITNVSAKNNSDQELIKDLLVKQIYSKVRWRESLNFMSENGVSDFVEVGPGKVLAGMVKRTLKNSKALSINTINDIKELIHV